MAMVRPAGEFDRSYRQDMAHIRQAWQWALLILSVLAVLAIPRLESAYLTHTANRIAYTIIAVQGINILTGYTGQISLGQAAFMMVGGFASALLATHLGLGIFITLPLAALVAGVVGLIFGLPSLRVKGFYLAVATLAAQFIIPWLSRNTFKDYLGGSVGSIDAPVPVIFGTRIDSAGSFLPITLGVLVITTILSINLVRTRLGRAFVAVRDSDLAAELLGVNLFTTKLRAFFIASAFAGLAGALQAHYQRGVGTEYGYDLPTSITLLGMLVVGGIGTKAGPFLGAITIILLEDAASRLGVRLSTIPELRSYAASLLPSFKPIFFGLVLMLFLIFEPRGLAHRWRLMLAAWRLRPFSH
jgi:branched-chain amino acid transport system permease protein